MDKHPEEIDCLILCALRPEASAIAGRLRGARRMKIGRCAAHRGRFSGRDTIVVRTGPGAQAAAAGTRAAFEVFAPGLVVCFGTAGAVDDALQVGDCLVCRSANLYDPNIRAEGKEQPPTETEIALDAQLAERLGVIPNVRFAVFGSADYSVADDAERQVLRNRFGFQAVDWETFAVLKEAHDRKTPAFSFRTITDLCGPDAEAEFLERHRQAVEQAARILAEILQALASS